MRYIGLRHALFWLIRSTGSGWSPYLNNKRVKKSSAALKSHSCSGSQSVLARDYKYQFWDETQRLKHASDRPRCKLARFSQSTLSSQEWFHSYLTNKHIRQWQNVLYWEKTAEREREAYRICMSFSLEMGG